MDMILKPQDLLVCLKLVALNSESWTYSSLSLELAMSASEANAAIARALTAGLVRDPVLGEKNPRPVIDALKEFLVHGVKYAFPPVRGELVRGVPTSHAAPALRKELSDLNEPPPVWPFEEGQVRGIAFSPLYRSVPKAAMNDRRLYDLLAFVDALRDRNARSAALATIMLIGSLERYGKHS